MRFIVLGGGIAGACCAEELCRLAPSDQIVLISANRTLKGVFNPVRVNAHLDHFDVVERPLSTLPYSNFEAVIECAESVRPHEKTVTLESGRSISYDRLCICTGAIPKALAGGAHVLTLRDRDSVADLAARLPGARRVVLVGNGGIALELAHALQGVEVVWVVRHSAVGDAFFDLDAADFLLDELQPASSAAAEEQADGNAEVEAAEGKLDNHRPNHERQCSQNGCSTTSSTSAAVCHQGESRRVRHGHAVGPEWASVLRRGGASKALIIERDSEVLSVASDRKDDGSQAGANWPVRVQLSNGRCYGADLVISAIGVIPNVSWLPQELQREPSDGGLLVDRELKTSVEGIWAAGDACSVRTDAQGPHWFQMRLWTQARQMGVHAAHSMAGVLDQTGSDYFLELFAHSTRFAGKTVVLLGLYNGQRLEHEPEEDMVTYSRALKGPPSSFVRVLLLRGRMMGALLIGETGYEETFENLILDGLDLSSYGPALLDPHVELDHMFD